MIDDINNRMNSEPASNKKIAEIKLDFMAADYKQIPALLNQYKNDERSGVKTLCKMYEKKLSDYYGELARLERMRQFELKYKDYQYICGIDEVGRGPLAGPVMACAVILPKDCNILYLNDSKKLSEKKREELYDEIIDTAIAYGIGSVPPARIDEINILQATYEAMEKAINNLSVKPDILLNDAVYIPSISIKQVSIVKGDESSISIAAASILAKVTRDRIMKSYDRVFPGYDFANNKGYGSAKHMEAIKKYGITPIHRRSFLSKMM